MDTETFTLLRDTVHRFVAERLIPAEDEVAGNSFTGQETSDSFR